MKLRAKAYLRIAAEEWRKKYNYVGPFIEGLAEVKLGDKMGYDGKYGFVNEQGEEVVKPKYDYVWNFFEGLASVELDYKYGYVDKKGNEVVPPKYDWAEHFDEGLAEVRLGDKTGWVTREGKELLLTEDQHIQIQNLIELEKITEEDLINWINERAGDKMKLRAKAYLRIAAEDWRKRYDWAAGTFHDGLAEVTINRKSGLVDETGKEVVPPIYDSIGGFEYGLAEVRLDGKYGFIDKTGEVVIPTKYSRVDRFNNGLAKVELGDKKGWVTKEVKNY